MRSFPCQPMFEIIKNNFLAAIFSITMKVYWMSLLGLASGGYSWGSSVHLRWDDCVILSMKPLNCEIRMAAEKVSSNVNDFRVQCDSGKSEDQNIKRREFGIISLSRDTNLRHSRRNALQFNIMQTCSNVCLWEHTKAGRKCTQYASRNLQNLLFIIKFPHPAVG